MNRTVGMTLDCVDVEAAATFWKEALGYEEPGALEFPRVVRQGLL
jgi:hypothetical protein